MMESLFLKIRFPHSGLSSVVLVVASFFLISCNGGFLSGSADGSSTPAPTAAQSLAWSTSSPSYDLNPSVSWALASNVTIASQKIQYYADGVCNAVSGAPVTLSASATSHNFSGADGSTYSFKILTIDSSGNTLTSACSSAIALDTSACVGARLTNTPYAGGSGTGGDPYLICTAAQMNAIGNTTTDWNQNFKLLADISLGAYTGTQYNMIGSLATPFTGVFAGNNHTISNLSRSSANDDYVGLFAYVGTAGVVQDLSLATVNLSVASSSVFMGGFVGYVNGGTLTNLNLLSGQILQTDSANTQMVGGIAGKARNATLMNLRSSGAFPTTFRSAYLGGVVGYMDGVTADSLASTGSFDSATVASYAGGVAGVVNNSTVSSSYSTSNVYSGVGQYSGGLLGSLIGNSNLSNSYATGNVSANSFGTGGLVGALATNSGYGIRNCYATGNVSGGSTLGGLVGEVSGPGAPVITNTYATGTVNVGAATKGALVASDNNSGSNWAVYTANFWNNQVNSTLSAVGSGSSPAGATGANTVALQTPSTFSLAGWTGVNWNLTTSGVFLKLQWQP